MKIIEMTGSGGAKAFISDSGAVTFVLPGTLRFTFHFDMVPMGSFIRRVLDGENATLRGQGNTTLTYDNSKGMLHLRRDNMLLSILVKSQDVVNVGTVEDVF